MVYVNNIGSMVKLEENLLRCNPQDFDTNDLKRVLPPPTLLPCYFNRDTLSVAIGRYEGILELLRKGLELLRQEEK